MTDADRESVDQLLDSAGLVDVSESERAALAAGYAGLRERTETLAVPWGLEPEGPGFTVGPWRRPSRAALPLALPLPWPAAVAQPTARWATVADLAAALRDGTTTSTSLLAGVLDRIDRDDEALGSVVALFDDPARRAAAAADAALAAGTDLGPLHGVPLIIKDILTTTEGPTRAQSKVPTPFLDRRIDATAVARLRRAGAIVVAKASTSEFAIGNPDEDAGFPDPRNPWDLDRWPGGSSSGTAAAVAAGLVPAGLGTDSGGSVRIPAALCGITGLKTTFGRVPTHGCVPLAPGLDTIGPLARTAQDCALLFDVLAGTDTSAGLHGDLSGLRIGVELDHHLSAAGLDPAVPGLLADAAGVLEQLGAKVEEVVIEDYHALRVASYAQLYSEAMGIHRDTLRSRWSDYGGRTRNVLVLGALYSSADYARALDTAARGKATMAGLFERLDVVLTPTVGMTAPRVDEEWFQRLMSVVFTTPWNLLGLPALTVPMGMGEHGLPLGLQLIGPAGGEGTVLRAGDAYQRVTDWHRAHPPTAN